MTTHRASLRSTLLVCFLFFLVNPAHAKKAATNTASTTTIKKTTKMEKSRSEKLEKQTAFAATTATTTTTTNAPSKAADTIGDTSAPDAQAKTETAKDVEDQKEGSDALIPDSYNKYRAPNDKDAIQVKFRILVQYFYSISQRDELLDFGLKVFKMWKDTRLAKKNMIIKTGDKHNEGVEVDPSLVWRPQSELRNAIERVVLSEELVIFPSGHVLLTQRLRVKVTVDFNMQWFPFDQQALKFVFGTFGRATTDHVQIVTTSNTSWYPAFPSSNVNENFLIESDLLERPQMSWKILSFYGAGRVVRGDASLLKYSEVDCVLRVQRGRWHYIIVFIVPMFLIVLVSSANYNFDMRDLEPRVTVSASLLLALVALQYSIEQQLPSVTYIMWMNWYLFICYLTISLQVASFVVVVALAGPQEDGTWTKKGHSDFRAKDLDDLKDSVSEVMGVTRTDPNTGDVILHLSKDDGKNAEVGAPQADLAKRLGLGNGEEGEESLAVNDETVKTPLLRKSTAVYLRRLSKRERRAKTVDFYFRWSYPLMFIFATFCMFMSIPDHLRRGIVDRSENAKFEMDYDYLQDNKNKNNGVSRVEIEADKHKKKDLNLVTNVAASLQKNRFVSSRK